MWREETEVSVSNAHTLLRHLVHLQPSGTRVTMLFQRNRASQ